MRRVAEIEETALIVAAQVRPNESKGRSGGNFCKGLQRCVFDFILVPRCRGKVRQQVTRLSVHARAVVLVLQREGEIAEFAGYRTRIRRILRTKGIHAFDIKTLHGIGDEFVIVRLSTSEMMVPM